MSRVTNSQYSYNRDLAGFLVGDYPGATWRFRQYFVTPSTITKITSVTLYMRRIGTDSSANVTVTLNGVNATRSSSGFGTSYGWYTFTFPSPVSVNPSTGYYIYVLCNADSLAGVGGYSGSSGGYYSLNGGPYYQSYTNSDGIEMSFASLAYYVSGYGVPQLLQATTVTNVTYNSATLSSGVYDDNGDVITRSGFVISNVTSSPTVPDNEIWVSTGMSNFSTTPTTLAFGSTYYVRSYATNSAGTNYGPLTSFTTPTPVGYVSTTPTWTVGQPLSLNFSNPGNLYLQVVVYVNNQAINTWNVGQVTSASLINSDGSTISNLVYQKLPNAVSGSLHIGVLTYSDSGYTNQIGSTQIRSDGTVYINQAINKPIFTTYTVGNLDKTIVNKDKYSNTLVSSSTSALLGSDTKMIKGYSKLRAVITSANKMVAQNYATAVKYRFIVGSAYDEENYSADSTVNLDVDNATTNSVSVTAYDSRSLTTTVSDTTSITYVANYVPVSLWGLTLTRDNGVDSGTKLAFSGSYWNEYFGGGTSGVRNTITAHYRYKETTEEWGTQTWNSITLTDTDGALSFDDYIDGDLGVSGFDPDKSFNIEVRIYDKLTNVIIEGTLNRGTPVMDITKNGVAFGARYDEEEGGNLQVLGKNILNWFYPVGTIYETTSSDLDTPAKMNAHFGGTWEVYGSGRVLVGKANSGTFATVGATMGEETHTLTSAESGLPAHTHGITTVKSEVLPLRTTSLPSGYNTNNTGTGTAYTFENIALNASSAHNNIQPSIVVYRYRRVA